MRQSATIAEGVFAPGLDPAIVQWRREVLEGAGADLGSFEYWVRTMVCVDDDADNAKSQVASYAATCAYQFYYSTLRWKTQDAARMRDELPGNVIDAVEHLGQEYDWYQHERRDATHAVDLPTELISTWVMFGPSEEIAERITELLKRGVDRLSMTLYTIRDKLTAMRRFVEEVVPKIG
jgi:alkanesulfonate monooxygenase SsuD/methylene tetrahydromethanopterin reductase-like flavin-dependent oxidoreductase (luciferase family)